MDASAHSSFSLIVYSTKPKSSPLIIINYFPVSPKYSSSLYFYGLRIPLMPPYCVSLS